MEEFIAKSSTEFDNYIKELISKAEKKEKEPLEITNFITDNHKYQSKELLLACMENQEISYNEILDFMNGQENTVKSLSRLFNDYQEGNIDHNNAIQKREMLESEFHIYHTFLKAMVKDLYILCNVKATLERMKKGKTPKAKKAEQLLAEEYATDIWKKDHSITQENMAYQLKDKLELKQSIRTIQNWIKPFQPKP